MAAPFVPPVGFGYFDQPEEPSIEQLLADLAPPDLGPNYGAPQEAMPNDFFARVAQGSGPTPFGQPQLGNKFTGLEALLAFATGLGNAKATQGARRVSETDQRNARARESAKDLANKRWEMRKVEAQATDRKAALASNEAYRRDTMQARKDAEEERIRQRELDRDLRDQLGKLSASAGTGKREATVMNTILDNVRQDKDVSGFVDIRDAYGVAKQAAGQGDSAGDIILMRMVAKATDPTTGVREEEFRTFQGAQGYLNRMGVKFTSDMVGAGQLTPAGRAKLMDTVEGIYQRKLKRHDQAKDFYKKQAAALGIDPSLVVRDYVEQDAGGAGGKATQADIDYVRSLGIKP